MRNFENIQSSDTSLLHVAFALCYYLFYATTAIELQCTKKKLLNFLGLKRKRRDDTLQMTLTSSSSSLTIPDMLNSFDQWGGFLFTNDATSETISNTPSKKSIFFFFFFKTFCCIFFVCYFFFFKGEKEGGAAGRNEESRLE
jgi:hypothetical protein